MDRQERKERIIDIIDQIKMLKEEIEKNTDTINSIIAKIYDLDNELYSFGEVEGWDSQELKTNVIKAFIDSTEFDSIKDDIEQFKNELDEYMYDLSESRREKLEEKYFDLENVLECFDIDECEDLDMLIERIDEITNYLKDMK
jgi:hypothetical protein